MAASKKGHIKVVKTLAVAGADLSAKTKKGTTALTLAEKKNHVEIMEFLVEAGAN